MDLSRLESEACALHFKGIEGDILRDLKVNLSRFKSKVC